MKIEFCDENNYILKHKVVNGQLVIYYADGSVVRKPYSIAEEKAVLTEEKNQIQSVVQDQDTHKKEWKKYKRKIAGFGAVSLIYLTSLIFAANIPTFLVTSAFLFFTARNIVNSRDAYKKVKDIEKYKMFLKNEDVIGDVVENRKYKQSSRGQAGIRKVNANTIDRYEYSDITKILRESDCPRSEYGDTDTFMNKASARVENGKKKAEKAKVKVKSLFR